MIYDKIENLGNYTNLKKVMEFLEQNKGKMLENGRYIIDKDCYVVVSEYETSAGKDFEAHREYIDLQMLVKGQEAVFVQNIQRGTPITEYDAEKDVIFYQVEAFSKYILDGSNFLVLDTEDLHKPSVSVGNPIIVKKYVFKIRKTVKEK